MSKIIFYFLSGIALALSAVTASAANTVATVPDGMLTLPIVSGVTNYLSLPLTQASIYTTTVTSVTTTTITVDDTPAPFTSSLMTAGAPYFVKFLSGNESGRVMLVTANTSSSLTVDTTDHISGEAVALTTTGFSVQAGDTFEVFPGDTLASVFGNGSSGNPLVIAGGVNYATADNVGLYTASNAPAYTYYFNSTAGYWEMSGSTANANNTIIYPYSGFTVIRRAANASTSLVLSGRVTQVVPSTKLANMASVYTSTHFATDVTLSQLQFSSNWVQGVTASTSDTIDVWNSTLNKFDIFYQLPNMTWRKYPDATTDQSSFTIPAGTVTLIAKKEAVSGATTFVQTSSLPYSLN